MDASSFVTVAEQLFTEQLCAALAKICNSQIGRFPDPQESLRSLYGHSVLLHIKPMQKALRIDFLSREIYLSPQKIGDNRKVSVLLVGSFQDICSYLLWPTHDLGVQNVEVQVQGDILVLVRLKKLITSLHLSWEEVMSSIIPAPYAGVLLNVVKPLYKNVSEIMNNNKDWWETIRDEQVSNFMQRADFEKSDERIRRLDVKLQHIRARAKIILARLQGA